MSWPPLCNGLAVGDLCAWGGVCVTPPPCAILWGGVTIVTPPLCNTLGGG